ncbi:keratin, type I cytoskeletal 47 kDa-like [Bombina bombina]|uniref:keratin, type I cytoskeletal 47 kDa-like n=1 Tax=Bombina bombina TaxID=8345 RepID=UPI00235AC9C5|nr:keratin, type I cytoskeletal 47 kDa-like [Bombina bombina]
MSCIAASRQESSTSHESMSGNGLSATNVSDEPSGYYGEDSGSNYGRSISSSSYSRASDGGSIRNIEWYSHGISRASSSDEQKVGTGESGDSGSRSYYFGEQQSSGPRGNTGRQLSDYSESKYSGVHLDDEQAGGPVIYLKDLDLDVYSAGGQSGGNGGSFSGVSGSTYYGQSSAFGKQGGYGDIAKMGTGLSERSPTAGYRASFEGSFSGTSVGDILLHTGGKETMQNLNSRLAAYIDKVRVLEAANAQLEYNIRKWYDSNKVVVIDNSKYFQMIEDLKNKIIAAILDNNKVILHIDNARVAAADFKLKYEAEVGLRQAADYDVNGLRKELDDLTLTKSSLEMKIESQREELTYLKKSHEEELKEFSKGLTGSVTVELDAAPGNDMLSILNEMRTQYENLAEENRIKAGEEFNRKTSGLNQEIRRHSEQVQLGKDETTELRRNLQSIEIDLQTQIALKNALENTLAETEGRYCVQLNKIQDLIRNLEEQLSKLRFEMEDQSTEYKLLMDIKTRLENEIEMYRHLLEGEG